MMFLYCLQLDPIYVMVISVAGYIWDAVTDPVIGYLTLLTNTRFGRLRPWYCI